MNFLSIHLGHKDAINTVESFRLKYLVLENYLVEKIIN